MEKNISESKQEQKTEDKTISVKVTLDDSTTSEVKVDADSINTMTLLKFKRILKEQAGIGHCNLLGYEFAKFDESVADESAADVGPIISNQAIRDYLNELRIQSPFRQLYVLKCDSPYDVITDLSVVDDWENRASEWDIEPLGFKRYKLTGSERLDWLIDMIKWDDVQNKLEEDHELADELRDVIKMLVCRDGDVDKIGGTTTCAAALKRWCAHSNAPELIAEAIVDAIPLEHGKKPNLTGWDGLCKELPWEGYNQRAWRVNGFLCDLEDRREDIDSRLTQAETYVTMFAGTQPEPQAAGSEVEVQAPST